MDKHFEEAIDGVDACVFTGDSLLDAGARAHLRDHLGRWMRQLTRFEEMATAIADQHQHQWPVFEVMPYKAGPLCEPHWVRARDEAAVRAKYPTADIEPLLGVADESSIDEVLE